MKHITVHIPDKNYPDFLNLVNNIRYVKKVQTDEEPSKQQILQELKEAVTELKLIEQGKLKSRPLKELLDEL